MCSSTFWKEHSLGKDSPADLKTRNMLPLRRRRLRPLWLSFARATPTSFRSSWSTAGPSNLSRSPTTSSASAFLRTAYLAITLTPRPSITPGSRTACPKIKKTWRPRCSESSKRSLPTRKNKPPNKKHSTARPTPDTLEPPWATLQSRLANREDLN